MAELVDALVSNTNAARRAGSIPALGTITTSKSIDLEVFYFLDYFIKHNISLFIKFEYIDSEKSSLNFMNRNN